MLSLSLLAFASLTPDPLAAQKLYVVATDKDGKRFRVLKIDRTSATQPRAGQPAADEDDESGLNIIEDSAVYTLRQKDELVETLRAGNSGLKLVEKPCFGIAGPSRSPTSSTSPFVCVD